MESPVLFTDTKIFGKLDVDVQGCRAEGCGAGTDQHAINVFGLGECLQYRSCQLRLLPVWV